MIDAAGQLAVGPRSKTTPLIVTGALPPKSKAWVYVLLALMPMAASVPVAGKSTMVNVAGLGRQARRQHTSRKDNDSSAHGLTLRKSH